jgi:rhamnulokinase
MKAEPAFVAIDLGAESGRVVVGRLGDGAVRLDEVSRFANLPLQLPDGLHWDVHELFRQTLAGVGRAAQAQRIESVAVDAWGVDYGLLDEDRQLLGQPFHYRDHRTEGLIDRAAFRVSPARAYAATGIRPMQINTVYQLLAEELSPAFQAARHLALIPDLLNFWLCGVLANERTAASTTGLLDARSGLWARDVIESLGLPARIFSEIVDPGTILGPVLPAHAAAGGLSGDVPVIATAAHDTAAAFAGVPADAPGAAILASGTWSLLGLEVNSPVLSEEAFTTGLSNEQGVFGTVRLLRSVMGLWLLQQCRATWGNNASLPGYDELESLAGSADAEPPLFDPDDPSLSYPGEMPAKIEALLRAAGQPIPTSKGALTRSILVSLACKYRLVIEGLERCSGKSITKIHVVGGGARNKLLCRLTADITRREVIAGPAEASALGNVLMQAAALRYISGADEMRRIARASVTVARYLPVSEDHHADTTYERFLYVTRLGSPGPARVGERGNT